MHWLPLVAMVIASALPFPHNPVSRIAAATAQPGFDDNHDQSEPVDYNSYGNASQMDYNMADTVSQRTHRQNLQDSEEYVKSSTDKQTSKVANQGTYQSNVNSGGDGLDGVLRVEDDALPKDYNADRSRQDFSSFTDSSSNPQDPTQELSPLATAGFRNSVSPAAALKAQSRPEPTESTIRTTAAGKGPTEGRLNLEAGLGLEGDEMFLDAHPRVLFSPSPSPPEHPPLLLMLESGMLEEDGGDGEEQEDMDAHIEGHGDRALDRTPSWADFSRVTPNVRAVKRDKRDKQSDLMDRRRGERSVCESESAWVTNKTTAIDYHGQNVTILQEIQTQTGPLKQYFYETRCRAAEQPSGSRRGRPTGTGVAGAGCLGVDKKQWVSECKAKQSFVRALTRDTNNRTGWRWIRIDSSCVCVLLSRTNQALAREVLMRRGRG